MVLCVMLNIMLDGLSVVSRRTISSETTCRVMTGWCEMIGLKCSGLWIAQSNRNIVPVEKLCCCSLFKCSFLMVIATHEILFATIRNGK